MMKRKGLERIFRYLTACTVILLIAAVPSQSQSHNPKTYVGSQSCEPCHEKQYASFIAYAAKANSFDHVQIMKKGLTDAEYRGCLKCHTTAYGEPGGFISAETTPALKNPGCEVCHGPGGQHIESGDPKDIQKPTMDICQKCHTSDRVNSFKFKPVLHGGAH